MVVEKQNAERRKQNVWKALLLILRRYYYQTRNAIYNGAWPTPFFYLYALCAIFFVLLVAEPISAEGFNNWVWKLEIWLLLDRIELSRWIKAAIVSMVAGIIVFIKITTVHHYLLRMLYHYRGWMYETPTTQTWKTFLWGISVRALLLGRPRPKIYSCRQSLPRQPVPPLKQTVERLLESLTPLSTEKEMADLRKSAKEFIGGVGWKLQLFLVLKSWLTSSYVTDWWEKYVYLMTRSPLPINSNYCCLDQHNFHPTPFPAARAGTLIHQYLKYKKEIETEKHYPMLMQGVVPICMEQYKRIFATTRVPGETIDRLVHYKPHQSKHMVVIRKGILYKVEVYDSKGQYLSSETLEKLFQWVIEDADNQSDQTSIEEKSVSVLTAMERTHWAKIRKEHFLKSEVNREALAIVEKAICCVLFPDFAPKSLTEKGRFLFHGDCQSFWFDKCVTYTFFSDGKAGWHAEHTVADAPAMGYFWEFFLSREAVEKFYTEHGHCPPPMLSYREGSFEKPQKIIWNMTSELVKEIKLALPLAKSNFKDLDLMVGESRWGKRLMKKWKLSPDGFIQIALQLAYFKEAGKLALTYEASMTRLYLRGRTETVRSCTIEAANFIKAMYDTKESAMEKMKLLRLACNRHQILYRDAMNGKGIDRHLFALYIASKIFGYDSDFLKKATSKPWTLSTSQQPQRQQQDNRTIQDCNSPYLKDKLSPGGGFGPVVNDGYGVSYMLSTDDVIYFYVASKHSSKSTSSKRFVDNLFQCMDDIKNLFESE